FSLRVSHWLGTHGTALSFASTIASLKFFAPDFTNRTALCRNLGEHGNGGVLGSPSTQGWAIRRHQYSPEGVTACKTLRWVMAKCCLEAQIKFTHYILITLNFPASKMSENETLMSE
uniref:Uncharacterized protein n=1 Tax=Aquila chrysaetos chrysaetos TaxID=223781 RepID=A0A663E7G0_AQUCH